MTDRLEPPATAYGYGASLAYGCLPDVIRSVSLVIDTDPPSIKDSEVPLETVGTQLLQSSWCSLLAAMALLLDASTEDSTAENILFMCLYSSLAEGFLHHCCMQSHPPPSLS